MNRPRGRARKPSSVREFATEEHSAGGVVVRVADGRHWVLLIRDPYKKWGLPKGHLEGAETGAQAAFREVLEETGLPSVEVGPELGMIDWHFRLNGKLIHKYCQFFLMATESATTCPEIAEGITECLWLPLDEALERVTYDNARGMIQIAADLLRDREPSFPPW